MSKQKLTNVQFAHKDFLQEGRFSFIKDTTLRENIAIYVQYITFLVSLDLEYDIGIITYSIYKDIVIHTAHVIESLLHYKLRKLMEEERMDESAVFGFKEKLTGKFVVHECKTEGSIVYAGLIEKKPLKLQDSTKFLYLNRAGKKCGLLTEDLFQSCEEIREMRNNVHLSGLKKVDDQYSKRDVSNLFRKTEKIIDRVRDY